MFCPNCGKQISDDFVFCPYCGKKTSAQPKEKGGYQYNAPADGNNGGYYVNPQGFGSYGQPNYNPYMQPSPYTIPNPKKYPGKGLGIAGMVVGICGVFYSFMINAVSLSIILGILGVVFGAVGMIRARSAGQKNPFAIAGLSCGIVTLVIDVTVIVYSVAVYGYYFLL